MVVAKSRWSSVSGVSSSSPLMPITAFIGVRISWLIVARKALLASLAASAWARASCVSLNIFAFWIAITAWSAKVLISAISLSVKGFAGMRATSKAPMPWPFQISGTYSNETLPIHSVALRTESGTAGPCCTSGKFSTSRLWAQ